MSGFCFFHFSVTCARDLARLLALQLAAEDLLRVDEHRVRPEERRHQVGDVDVVVADPPGVVDVFRNGVVDQARVELLVGRQRLDSSTSAFTRSWQCMNSRNFAGALRVLRVRRDAVALRVVIGMPAIEPVPKAGQHEVADGRSPSVSWAAGSAAVVLIVIAALPVSVSWMPW